MWVKLPQYIYGERGGNNEEVINTGKQAISITQSFFPMVFLILILIY